MRPWRIWDYSLSSFTYAPAEKAFIRYGSPRYLLMPPVEVKQVKDLVLWSGDTVVDANDQIYMVCSDGNLLRTDLSIVSIKDVLIAGRLEFNPLELSEAECQRLGIPASWQVHQPLI